VELALASYPGFHVTAPPGRGDPYGVFEAVYVAHEVLEDAWKGCAGAGRPEERELWRGLAQLAVGLTHAARGNAVGGARLLLRGADRITPYGTGPGPHGTGPGPYGIEVSALAAWARGLAERLDRDGGPVDPAAEAPRLRGR
ncbi:DUF309 domain-containing protein, partial [Streptomyces fradiae]|uniref:DUF309 domain-containing protein n=1 Tax=Streptomyces fradiae TaxID=1906 RepID=UPI00340F5D49